MYATPEKQEGATTALTRPDILNLISTDAQHLENMVWTIGNIVELVLSLAIGCFFLWWLLGESYEFQP